MRAVLVDIDFELLRDLLSLPETSRIVRAETDNKGIHVVGSSETLTLVVEDPSLPDVGPGSHLARKNYTCRHHRTPAQFIEWV